MLAASLRLVDLSWMTPDKKELPLSDLRSQNRLARETSPYLLSHATNPVDWFPWGEEALAKAKAEDKPIFLSIGYAACHWCHVMERESFEDDGVAKLMNEGFVSIKVDREERPDIDSVYMTATVAMSGSGGWPMSVFLTPSGAPFFAGTYFPKSSKYGRPGFTTILERIRDLWTTDRKQLLEQAKELVRALEDEAAMTAPRPIEANVVELAVRQLGQMFDPHWGGFGGAPKFPAPFSLELLLRHHARTGDAGVRHMVVTTLDKMAEGGIFDHVGGGFARYSTDEKWLAPHFEKMLYDNAQLARVYVLASQALGEPRFAEVAKRTLDYVVREMQGAHGGYFSATDADSEGVEGKFFVWSLREIEELLEPADARAVAAAYDVTEEGNWEEHNILWTPKPLDEVARELEMTREALETILARSREILYAARLKRVPPLLDDKVLAAWNGLMIGAMAVASRVLGEPRYLASAARAATTILERLRRPDGGLFRTFREDRAHVEAFLEDYAFLADGLIDLYESSGDARWLKEALSLAERAAVDFAGEPEQGFYSTSKQAERLVVRMRESQDGATPSANAVLARALVRLSHHADRADLRDAAESAIRAHGRAIGRAPRAFTTSIDVVERLLAPPMEIALVGTDRAGADALEAELRKTYLPHAVIARSVDGVASTHPLLAGKTAKDGVATAYVCRDFACNAPVTTAADLARDLDEALARWRGGAKAGIAPKAAAGSATAAATRSFLDAHPSNAVAGDAPPLEGRFGDAWISRAGILVASHTEGDAKAVVVAAVRAGRNVIAFDLGRAPLVGDALAELASSGGPLRDALVLIGILHEPEASHAAKIAAGARAAELDAILVPWSAGEGVRDDAALTTAAALNATGLTKNVGFFFERALTTTDLERIASASKVSVVGAPLNLLEGEVAPVAAAKARGITFIALRPLDAIVAGRLVPFVDPASLPAVGPTGAPFAAVLAELGAMEEQYRRTLSAHVQVPPGLGIDAQGLLELSNELSALAREAADVDDVQTFASQGLGSALEAQARLLGTVPTALREGAQRLHEKYVGAVERALSSIARRIASEQAAGTRRLAAVLTPDRGAALPALALGAVLGTEGVAFALATTRTTAHASSPEVVHSADAFARARAKG